MSEAQPRPALKCAGVPITAMPRRDAARTMIELALTPRSAGVDVHLCNAYTLALADKDPELHALLCAAPLNFPDGKSVVWANRIRYRGESVPPNRVCGPDLLTDTFELGQEAGVRHFLLGSTAEVLGAMRTELERRFPEARIVGASAPPFRAQTEAERGAQLELIRSAAPHIVWVGLGTPKQDFEAHRLASDLPLVFVAVGAAFDFVAGSQRRAPEWMRESGLEWTFRLATEPRRLWKRYLLGNFRFLRAAARRT